MSTDRGPHLEALSMIAKAIELRNEDWTADLDHGVMSTKIFEGQQ